MGRLLGHAAHCPLTTSKGSGGERTSALRGASEVVTQTTSVLVTCPSVARRCAPARPRARQRVSSKLTVIEQPAISSEVT